MEGPNKTTRILRLTRALFERGRLTTLEASRIAGTDRRKALADLKAIAEELDLEPMGEGQERRWVLPPELLGRRDRLGVLDHLSFSVGRAHTAFLGNTCLATLERVPQGDVGHVPDRLSHCLDRKFYVQAEPSRPYEERDEVLQTLVDGLLSERVLTVRYVRAEQVEERQVEPLTLVIYRRAVYLLCIDAGEEACLSVDRVLEASLGPSFDYPESWNPRTALANRFGIWSEPAPAPVELVFRPGVARYVRGRTWHASQQLEELSDGQIRLRFVAGGRELVRFCLEWGPQVRVISPHWLQQEVQKQLLEALEQYQLPEPAPDS